jgi:nucleoid-associated protein YgaU
MRKDVRFGLAIGGSLLALLVICAALFDRGGSGAANDVAIQPATQPVDVMDTSTPASPANSTQQPDQFARAGSGAATQPTAAVNSAANDWTTLLQTGGSQGAGAVEAGSPATRPSDDGGAILAASYTRAPTTRPLTAAGTHKVALGETFSTIAASVYGDSRYYARLEEANPTVNPNRLRVGTIINVPAGDDAGAAKAAPPRKIPAEAGTAPIDSSKSYRVRPSDTLMAIARRLYGDGQEWQKIYDANRDVIGANPARLQVGMVLRLPGPPTVAAGN